MAPPVESARENYLKYLEDKTAPPVESAREDYLKYLEGKNADLLENGDHEQTQQDAPANPSPTTPSSAPPPSAPSTAQVTQPAMIQVPLHEYLTLLSSVATPTQPPATPIAPAVTHTVAAAPIATPVTLSSSDAPLTTSSDRPPALTDSCRRSVTFDIPHDGSPSESRPRRQSGRQVGAGTPMMPPPPVPTTRRSTTYEEMPETMFPARTPERYRPVVYQEMAPPRRPAYTSDPYRPMTYEEIDPPAWQGRLHTASSYDPPSYRYYPSAAPMRTDMHSTCDAPSSRSRLYEVYTPTISMRPTMLPDDEPYPHRYADEEYVLTTPGQPSMLSARNADLDTFRVRPYGELAPAPLAPRYIDLTEEDDDVNDDGDFEVERASVGREASRAEPAPMSSIKAGDREQTLSPWSKRAAMTTLGNLTLPVRSRSSKPLDLATAAAHRPSSVLPSPLQHSALQLSSRAVKRELEASEGDEDDAESSDRAHDQRPSKQPRTTAPSARPEPSSSDEPNPPPPPPPTAPRLLAPVQSKSNTNRAENKMLAASAYSSNPAAIQASVQHAAAPCISGSNAVATASSAARTIMVTAASITGGNGSPRPACTVVRGRQSSRGRRGPSGMGFRAAGDVLRSCILS